MAISKEVKYLDDFVEEAKISRLSFGVTDRYSTGLPSLDIYLGGGFGRQNGYEIILIYGPTGIGKSAVALNFLADAARRNVRIGIMALEDSPTDVLNRFEFILTDQYDQVTSQRVLRTLSEDALDKEWSLEELAKEIESWFTDQSYGVDLILLDHLQFAFEGAEQIKGENEWIAQRRFMKRVNQLTKKTNKTLILVSHVSKMNGRNVGLNKIAGSSGIAGASTKAIEVSRKGDQIDLLLDKSRFTPRRYKPHTLVMNKVRLEELPSGPIPQG